MARRDLLLAVPELGVVLLEHDPLRLERCGELVDVVLRRRRRDRREAERRVDRHVPALDARRERELVLERRPQGQPAPREPLLHPLEEGALAHGCRFAVERDVIGEHGAGVRRVREDAKRLEVRHETHLADRAHPLHRLELVERVHRLHRDGQADAGLEPPLQPVPRRRLRAHSAVVAAPEKADEAEIRLVRSNSDVPGRHAGVWLHCRRR